jgi:NAD(P)-dependent dehydrogenase (short-subunit alcohol dehydrogenase family)
MNLYQGTEMRPAPEYLITKAGLLGTTRLLAQVGSEQNVLVNCISPGGVENGQPKDFVKKYNDKTLLGRMVRPSEVATLIEYFLTKNTYITGQNILIDGGYSIK